MISSHITAHCGILYSPRFLQYRQLLTDSHIWTLDIFMKVDLNLLFYGIRDLIMSLNVWAFRANRVLLKVHSGMFGQACCFLQFMQKYARRASGICFPIYSLSEKHIPRDFWWTAWFAVMQLCHLALWSLLSLSLQRSPWLKERNQDNLEARLQFQPKKPKSLFLEFS